MSKLDIQNLCRSEWKENNEFKVAVHVGPEPCKSQDLPNKNELFGSGVREKLLPLSTPQLGPLRIWQPSLHNWKTTCHVAASRVVSRLQPLPSHLPNCKDLIAVIYTYINITSMPALNFQPLTKLLCPRITSKSKGQTVGTFGLRWDFTLELLYSPSAAQAWCEKLL